MATMLIDRDFDNPLVNQSDQNATKTRSYGGSESSSKERFVKTENYGARKIIEIVCQTYSQLRLSDYA